jgi:DNA-binding cell septation regulator SpoVG
VTAPIEVLEVRPVTAGNVRAFCKVRLGAVVIHGCKVVQQPNQRAWVALPQQQSKDGKWFPVVEITSESLLERVRAAVLEAWEGRRQEVIPPQTRTHRNKRRDPREEAVDHWAARFDARGPDQNPGF